MPVCPHGGGIGLCEIVQHLSMFDYVSVSGSLEVRVIEYVDHLHEHFATPAVVRAGCYQAPRAAGTSAEILTEARRRYRFPDGDAWTASAL